MEKVQVDEKKGLSKRDQRFRVIRAVAMCFPFFVMGTAESMSSTVIPDLRVRLNATTEQISYSMSMGALGRVLGGPLAGFADRFLDSADFQIGLMFCLCGTCYALMPYSVTWVVLGTLDFMLSAGNSFASSAQRHGSRKNVKELEELEKTVYVIGLSESSAGIKESNSTTFYLGNTQ